MGTNDGGLIAKAYLQPYEIECLEKAAPSVRDRLLIRLLWRLGSRVSEVVALTVEDIDLYAGTVTIQHLKMRLNLTCPQCNTKLGRSHSFCPGCGAHVEKAVAQAREHRRRRVLPVDRDTLDMLKEYIQRGGPVEKDGKRLVFGISCFRAWQVISESARKVELPSLVNPESGRQRGVSPHRLRDAFAVHAVKVDDSGDGLRLLQEHLGHASFNTTARYRKVSGQEHRIWYDNLWEGSQSGETPGSSR
ncbi:MAG: tyrosine-type recombinase/integrase [Dehalococcoidia bacterium]